MRIVLVLLAITIWKPQHQAAKTTCYNGWLQFNESCYLFGHNPVHFTEAEHFCRQHHNSHLIHINDKFENAYIKDMLRQFKANSWWMGLTDEEIEGVWKWFDTEEVTSITDWGTNQPDNSGGEDCVIFYEGFDYHWADVSCTQNYVPLCESSGEACTGETEMVG
ncbi:perlucin-like protein [Mercenaria mercenaria]|uniref:perlucin-like protein n=1 Tax=Mercenaria mercenaria TaxID=6596 RepID=UPI00234F2409|nr:perlucin-like protein [Mercenaria mercenaria]